MTHHTLPRVVAVAALIVLASGRAAAWYFPEHRDISAAGIAKLGAEEQNALAALLAEARAGEDGRLCALPFEGTTDPAPTCIDLAALPALAGDHSCSPAELAERVLPSGWVLGVARVGQETRAKLAVARTRDQTLNVLARSNLDLQLVDPEYATRAGSNSAHFLPPRKDDDLPGYLAAVTREGAPLNALGLYLQYHLSALALAHEYATRPPPPERRPVAARKILVTEAYALHWLEDIYAAGHVVGTWGDTAWRKGTHDYYSEFGLDHVTWGGNRVVLFGDGHMKPADERRAAEAVGASLAQLVAALRPDDPLASLAPAAIPDPDAVFHLDSCVVEAQPPVLPRPELWTWLEPQMQRMPVPSRGAGDVHPARFREELGPFIGGFATVTGALRWGGFGPQEAQAFGSLAAGLRLGFGAESLTGSSGTGIAWLEAGVVMQSAQNYPCSGGDECAILNFVPNIPARTGLRTGIRLPFYVIPGDLLLLGPVLALASPGALSSVVVAATSGGLVPYERKLNVGAGTLQIVAGRIVDATFFGYLTETVILVPITPIPPATDVVGVARLKSVQLNFPVLEWTPFRTFATQLVFTSPLQLGFGMEIPISSPVVLPAGYPDASLGIAWSVFLRASFEGRFFFGSREDLAAPR